VKPTYPLLIIRRSNNAPNIIWYVSISNDAREGAVRVVDDPTSNLLSSLRDVFTGAAMIK
jgi:hypothetical protein